MSFRLSGVPDDGVSRHHPQPGVIVMKKIGFVLLLLLAVSMPLAAQPQYCFGSPNYCQYLDDQAFSVSPSLWSFNTGSGRASVTDACAWGIPQPSTWAASLAPGGGVWQWVSTEDEEYWAVDLEVYFSSAAGTSDDNIYVEVTNSTYFNQTEMHTIRATDYGTCANVHISLNNPYENSGVRIKVWRDYSSTMSNISVDDIGFWGGPSN
jgi:hypothetical protein